MTRRGRLHHLELWRDDATSVDGPWPWLLGELGYTRADAWPTGCRWHLDESYVVLESGPDHVRGDAERLRSGLNHLAFWAGTRDEVDSLTDRAPARGWRLLFADRHPYAGGVEHYAAYLEDDGGFEVELVAEEETNCT